MRTTTLFALIIIGLLAGCNHPEPDHLSPLQKLIEGNNRFMAGEPIHPDETLQRIRELKHGQHPFAVVVSCSDSRVPPELVFDQGLGNIFSVRTAGNVIGDYELGSIEYAVEHLHCKLIIVLGHEECGAIKAFVESKGCYAHLDHIKNIIEYLDNEPEEKNLIASNQLVVGKAVKANIEHGVNLLKTSEPVLKELYESKQLDIFGAIYGMETGKVTFSN